MAWSNSSTAARSSWSCASCSRVKGCWPVDMPEIVTPGESRREALPCRALSTKSARFSEHLPVGGHDRPRPYLQHLSPRRSRMDRAECEEREASEFFECCKSTASRSSVQATGWGTHLALSTTTKTVGISRGRQLPVRRVEKQLFAISPPSRRKTASG